VLLSGSGHRPPIERQRNLAAHAGAIFQAIGKRNAQIHQGCTTAVALLLIEPGLAIGRKIDVV
jgi:hypothetical protein